MQKSLRQAVALSHCRIVANCTTLEGRQELDDN